MPEGSIAENPQEKGDYLWAVKANQAQLQEAIADAFKPHDDAPSSEREQRLSRQEQQTASSLNKGHGRIEARKLTSTTALNGYLDWPGVKQVFRLERTRTVRNQTTTEVAYGITSLSRDRADATRLLELTRGHWGIENRLHYVRDVTFGEDACRVRTGQAPQNLAAIRNLAVTVLNHAGWKNKAAALRRYAAQPHEALALIRGSPTEN